jgi:hypothetical protein
MLPPVLPPVLLIELPPTGLPPTTLPPTGLPPTGLPPTTLPPTGLPPTGLPPTGLPPTGLPPTALLLPPTALPPVLPVVFPPEPVLPPSDPPCKVFSKQVLRLGQSDMARHAFIAFSVSDRAEPVLDWMD